MNKTYRPEIDGLRALAVLPVILYHAGIEIFNGGYVGVDIFFVISGYLITAVILKDIEKKKFSIASFYQRRARRILPALIIVITLSLPISIFLLPAVDLKDFSKSIISSLTFWSNFQFSAEAGYFNTPGEYKPLLHTWSLSIEEQFYILYPIFFIFLFKISRNFLIFSIALTLILSLFFAQWSGNLNRAYPFFDSNLQFYSQSQFSEFMMPFGRIWELALGGICAFLLNSKSKYSKLFYNNNKNLLFNIYSIIGFFLIFFSFFYLSQNFPYPSFYSLFPTLGTALLILFAKENTLIKKILSMKILVFIGLISYSAYLFHYPIFSFLKYLHLNINNITYIYIIPLILFISFLNWKFVEKPFRNRKTPIKKLILFVAISYLLLIPICFYIYFNDGLKNREKFILPQEISKSFVFEKDGLSCFDIAHIHKKENQEMICKIGNIKKNKIDFIAFGDSHLVSFHSLFDELGKKHNKKGLFLGYSGCPPILNVYPIRSDQIKRNCHELNKLVLNLVREKNIQNLVLVSRWTYYTDGNNFGNKLQYLNLSPSRSSNKSLSRKAFHKGLKDTLKIYETNKTNVFLLEQAPFQNIDSKKIYYRSHNSNPIKFKKNIIKYSVDLEKHNNLQKFVNKIFDDLSKNYKNLNIISLKDLFCSENLKKCLVGNTKHSFYIDNGHLSFYGVNLIKDKINNFFKKL